MRYHMMYPSPVGLLLLTSDGSRLTGLWMDKEPPVESVPGEDVSVLQKTKDWLDIYFRGEVPGWAPPLAPEGTPFQKRIWQYLLEIPFGHTCTYGELARRAAGAMGKEKMSSQAVGGAVGRNPISIIIPCHRCVGTNGKLIGYAAGLERKQWLLRHEDWKGADEK